MKTPLENPCQEKAPDNCQSPCEKAPEHASLWGVSYHLTDYSGVFFAGTALVLARDARHAEQILKSYSAFNGTQELIIIEAVAQVPTLTEFGLCIEAYTDGTKRIINYGE